MAAIRKDDGTIVARHVEFADSLPRQILGLMFRRSIPEDYAMIFDMRYERFISIHMLFVPFPIDLAFLGRDRTITGIRPGLRPWIGYAATRKPSQYVIEAPAGTLERYGLSEGTRLQW